MNKIYKKSDLDVHTYGHGRNKNFVIYTDYDYILGEGQSWSTRVYPDIEGNKEKAIKQALEWLNAGDVGEPWIIRNSRKKISLTYKFGY